MTYTIERGMSMRWQIDTEVSASKNCLHNDNVEWVLEDRSKRDGTQTQPPIAVAFIIISNWHTRWAHTFVSNEHKFILSHMNEVAHPKRRSWLFYHRHIHTECSRHDQPNIAYDVYEYEEQIYRPFD